MNSHHSFKYYELFKLFLLSLFWTAFQTGNFLFFLIIISILDLLKILYSSVNKSILCTSPQGQVLTSCRVFNFTS